jgi:hypothetical protein
MKYFGQWRRLAEDHEELPEVSEAMVTPAAIRMMRQRLVPPNHNNRLAPLWLSKWAISAERDRVWTAVLIMIPANRRSHRVVVLEVPLVIRRTVRVSGEVEFPAVTCRPCIAFSLRLQKLNSLLYAALHNKYISFKRSLFANDGSTLSNSRANVDYPPFCQNRDFRTRWAQAILWPEDLNSSRSVHVNP